MPWSPEFRRFIEENHVSEQTLPEADTDSAESCRGADIASVSTRLSASPRRRTARRSSPQSVAIHARHAASALAPGESDHIVGKSAFALRPVGIVDRIGAAERSHTFLTPAKLEAFVAVAEDGTV